MAITALTECQKCVAYKIFLASHGLSFGCALHVHSVSHRMSTTIYCRLSIVGENYTAEKYAVTIDYGYRDVPGKIAQC